jgi:orotidine-5'-phosphate decarboxylase
MMIKNNPICVALDTPALERAVFLSKLLLGKVGMMKIGMEFFYAHGPRGYEAVAHADIP